jgi:hypothetical protein
MLHILFLGSASSYESRPAAPLGSSTVLIYVALLEDQQYNPS